MNLIPVLYENDEIYVINKPSGLAVQGGQGVSHSLDVDFSKQVGTKIHLVHRLDKDTSGLMIVAKSPIAANKWTKLIASKVAEKEYIALCAGKMPQKKGVISENVVQHGETKNAITHYEVEKEWKITIPEDKEKQLPASEIPLTQIRLKLETGRMHQIRIHLAKLGCPIIGDELHGNFKINKLLKKHYKVKKFLLCSQKLTIPLSKISGKTQTLQKENQTKTFEIELPIDFML